MGAIAEAFVKYAQPLIDQTDGSEEQLNSAFAMSQLCFNLAQMPEESRDRAIDKLKLDLGKNEEEFEDFRRTIVLPMIRRYEELFLNRRGSTDGSACRSFFQTRPSKVTRDEKYPGTDLYAPCPCNSGEKYKFCCRKKK